MHSNKNEAPVLVFSLYTQSQLRPKQLSKKQLALSIKIQKEIVLTSEHFLKNLNL